jgi:hypothetical protein
VAVSAMGAAMVDQATANTVRGDLTLVHQWYATQFAYLVGKLKALPEGSGTVLDNTLLFWTNELGLGGVHSPTNIPYVLAGKCGGALTTGRYLDFLGTQTPAFGVGQAHNRLLVSILNMFGQPDTTFGLPDFRGPLPGL